MAIRENYHDLLNGNYDKFFHKYNCNVEFEYDIIRNFGDNKKLKVDLLNPNEIVKLENKSKLYNMEIEKALQEVDKLELNCSGGIESIFIDVEGKIHICIFDEVAFELDCLIENKYLLIDRNKIITSMYNDSKCSACKNHIGCKRCPIKQKLTLRDETNEWRCELANLRKNFFVESHR
jgi:hypothetical protein